MHKKTGNEKMGQGKRKRGEGAWGGKIGEGKARGRREDGKAEREEEERSLIGM